MRQKIKHPFSISTVGDALNCTQGAEWNSMLKYAYRRISHRRADRISSSQSTHIPPGSGQPCHRSLKKSAVATDRSSSTTSIPHPLPLENSHCVATNAAGIRWTWPTESDNPVVQSIPTKTDNLQQHSEHPNHRDLTTYPRESSNLKSRGCSSYFSIEFQDSFELSAIKFKFKKLSKILFSLCTLSAI
jgi:hypothetical protein